MATSFNVNIGIQSIIGIKLPSGSFDAPSPNMQTTRTLNGQTFEDTGITDETRILFFSPINTFDNIRTNTTSTVQPVTLTNYGNTDVFITATYFTANGTTPVFDLTPGTPGQVEVLTTSQGTFRYGFYNPIIVPAGGDVTVGLSYYGDLVGEWTNGIIFKTVGATEEDYEYYKATTRQIVGDIYEFSLTPTEVTHTFTTLEDSFIQTFDIIPYQGATEEVSIEIQSATSAFNVIEQSTSSFTVKFDPNRIANINNTYTATIVVSAKSGAFTDENSAVMTAIVNVPAGSYQGVGAQSYWIGPGSYDNSIVGVSYDKIAGRRTITIGVGAGDPGVPSYTQGGKIYATANSIGRYGGVAEVPYPGWANVYRIPVNEVGDTTPRIYYSKDFQVKSYGTDYGSYFGEYESEGSMFLVHDDGDGEIRVEITHLRELSGDESIDRTLRNLTRSLYYYSTVDDPNRYPNNETGNLETSPTNAFGDFVQDGLYTHMFLGFLKNGRVVASTVDLPIAP
jgi:hypothetical protein